jgi:hypothetical protein
VSIEAMGTLFLLSATQSLQRGFSNSLRCRHLSGLVSCGLSVVAVPVSGASVIELMFRGGYCAFVVKVIIKFIVKSSDFEEQHLRSYFCQGWASSQQF